MRCWRFVLAGLLGAYVVAYAGFRATHVEVWQTDKRPYVIFPAQSPWLYYAFRPLTYLDGTLTGMGFHLGPHR